MSPEVAALALSPEHLERLRATTDLSDLVVSDFSSPEGRKALARTDVLLSGWGCPRLDAAVLADAPRLSAVVHAAGSVKGFLAPEVWDRGILVSSAAEANAAPVAHFTVSAIQLAGKRAFRLAHAYRNGDHQDPTTDPDIGNHGRTVGIVGASRIGRLVLGALAGRGYRLLVSDPFLHPDDAAGLGAELVELDTLLRESDVVSLHAPLLPETRGLLDDRRLSLLRDGAVIVNTARGALIDTAALTRHCADGRIDAVLDVTEPEPLPAGHPLLGMGNVLLTPHLAGAMGTEIRLLGEFAVTEVERFAHQEPLLGQVTAEDLHRIA
ncbi:hydroxyacid dehydrogenase [Streptomyces beijiangensis]|uniref:Hydroxyacid dehydrogenase n=2 Tax=Streptomyces beijiangensis TaxID=163361 RepID=A0A939JFT3_9ACTN|nr:hydroxyacid dehydrogenase [Streptomyces beijiangensis]